MGASSHDDKWQYVRTYVKVFIALMVLTALTVGASYFRPGIPLAIAVALLIATLKGSLVASFFMHLITEQRLIFGALMLTGILLAALLALPLLTTKDQIGAASTPWMRSVPASGQMRH